LPAATVSLLLDDGANNTNRTMFNRGNPTEKVP